MPEKPLIKQLERAVTALRSSSFTTVFTGAGISVESGIPPFRGEGGIWNKYDPELLYIDHFLKDPTAGWVILKEIFYDFFGTAKPNAAHRVLSRMEKENFVHRIITQNIDNLHQEAGSSQVYEFHGNSKTLVCLACFARYHATEVSMEHLPPTCRQCGGLLKPNFVFFGEGIPQLPLAAAHEAAEISSVFLIIGTTGEVAPANQFPFLSKANGATILEINPEPSRYTENITDIFLQGKAGEIMEMLEERLFPASL